jgi:hypothetical protein
VKAFLVVLLAASALFIVACDSDSSDVASLERPGARAEPTRSEDTTNLSSEDEAAVMTFAQCMRGEGIEFKDPMVDSEGNVQRPELVEGFKVAAEELRAAYQVCSKHLEGLTLTRERPDVTEVVDRLVAVTTCLRDKGFDVDDPTPETLVTWRAKFRSKFDWDTQETREAYEECRNPNGDNLWRRRIP